MAARRRVLACAAVSAALLIPPTATAQAPVPRCAETETLLARLTEDFGERIRGAGLTAGHLLQVFAGDAGTWTVVVTGPDGVSCILAAGEHWRDAAPGPPPATSERAS